MQWLHFAVALLYIDFGQADYAKSEELKQRFLKVDLNKTIPDWLIPGLLIKQDSFKRWAVTIFKSDGLGSCCEALQKNVVYVECSFPSPLKRI